MSHVVMFDLDGTLVDSPRAIVETFTAAFESMGVAAVDPAAIRATIGLPLDQAFGKLLGVPKDDDQAILGVQRYLALFKEIILPRATELLFPGVVEGLADLRGQGFTLTVATSKFYASADALLSAAGIRDRFEMVVGADQVTHPKPHPETGLTILEKFGVRPGDAVMVGDTTHDLLMAKAAGVRAIAVTYGVHSPSELASAEPARTAGTFGEVVEYIKELASESTVVDALLGDKTYHIEFNGHLTNHAKHAVVALAGLGVDPRKIKAYYDGYAEMTSYGYGLEAPRPSKHEITEANWQEFLGKRTSFSAYCDFFDAQEKELGLDELLKQYMPVLLPGWVGSFTHATIHLGWALDAKSRWMTIEGLAYLAFSYVSCHPERSVPARSGELSVMDSLLHVAGVWQEDHDALAQWVQELLADTESGFAAGIHPELARSGLQYRIARLLEEGHPEIYATPSWVEDQDPSVSFEQLYYAVTLLYLATPGDFVLLHLITALHAMEQIAEHLPSEQRKDVVKAFWIGTLCIVFSGADFPTRTKLAALHAAFEHDTDAGNTGVEQDWKHLIARAVEEDEEHNPKLVYVLQRVWERTGRRSVYRSAAGQFTSTPELPKSFEEPPNE